MLQPVIPMLRRVSCLARVCRLGMFRFPKEEVRVRRSKSVPEFGCVKDERSEFTKSLFL